MKSKIVDFSNRFHTRLHILYTLSTFRCIKIPRSENRGIKCIWEKSLLLQSLFHGNSRGDGGTDHG